MLKNRGQFQRGMSLPEFVEQCGTQSQCERALFAWRWPLGFVCPECGGSSACALKSRRLYQCRACGRQTSVTVRPLIFSNPATGQVETIASGEPCNLVGSIEEAKRSGLLQDPMAIWDAETNLKRGNCVVLLRGVLRGVERDDIAPRTKSSGYRGLAP